MHGVIGLPKAHQAFRLLEFPPRIDPASPSSIFHERWWLEAVAPSKWREVTVEDAGRIIGRLPFFEARTLGLRTLGMPPLTRTLGPWIADAPGKTVTRRERESHIIAELVRKLPRHHFFRQLLPPTNKNLLALQSLGFSVGIEHVVEIDSRLDADTLWNEMHHKMRSLIRRAEQRQTFEVLNDPEEYYRFYQQNIETSGRATDFSTSDFMRLYEACRERNACTILAMRDENKSLAAAIFLVWWSGRMHFLMQTRDPSTASNGAIECLIWKAVTKAREQGMILDLDGIPNRATAHRLLPFGGELRQRAILTRGSAVFLAARQFKKSLSWDFDRRSIFC
jgi:hypothetical protein